MRRLKQATVKKGKAQGRVTLTLENDNGVFQAWLTPEQAERLAAAIFTCRFDFPVDAVVNGLPVGAVVNPPPKWRKPPKEVIISFSTTMPRPFGPPPSMDLLRHINDPARRKQAQAELEKEHAQFNRNVQKMRAKRRAEFIRQYGSEAPLEPKKR